MLALLARDENGWLRLLVFVGLFVLPIAIRVVKAVLTALGVLPPEGAEGRGTSTRLEELRRAREAQQRTRDEGEDLWRRLARGEVLEAPAERPAPPRASVTSEDPPAPSPLSMIGEVEEEPGEVPGISLETEVEPAPLASLAATDLAPADRSADVLGGRGVAKASPRGQRAQRLLSGRGELRRAVVLAEVLARPVWERPLER